MQALSPRKKPKFFCSSVSIILYMNQNMQVLFAIFIAEISNNFVGKSIAFTDHIKEKDRVMFVQRYWFHFSIEEIAETVGVSKNYVTVHLHRTREKLRLYLIA